MAPPLGELSAKLTERVVLQFSAFVISERLFQQAPHLCRCLFLHLVVAWVYVARVNPALLCPNMLDTVFTSIPFCKARVAKVCRRSWKRICSNPASLRIF